nr:MAG TPA: hypothetical protein [Caudoviricetes sp.]
MSKDIISVKSNWYVTCSLPPSAAIVKCNLSKGVFP